MKLNKLDWIALTLVLVGGLNWGLVAFNWNLVDSLLGAGSQAAWVVYLLVGLSSLYVIFFTLKKCMGDKMM